MIKLSSLGDEVSVWMDAPPAQVWDLVSDVTRIGEFSPETFEAKWTRGSTGPEVGELLEHRLAVGGRGAHFSTTAFIRSSVVRMPRWFVRRRSGPSTSQ